MKVLTGLDVLASDTELQKKLSGGIGHLCQYLYHNEELAAIESEGPDEYLESKKRIKLY